MRKTLLAALAVLLALVTLTGCANMETQSDEEGIRYSGGAVFPEAIEFKECQGPNKQEFGAPGDNNYVYKVINQRSFKFSDDPGSDSPPLTTSAPGPGGGQPIEMRVSGIVYFTPKFDATPAGCDSLRKFHERIGLRYEAWTTDGWKAVLNTFIKDSTDRTVDNEALRFDWIKLTSNGDAKAAWEQAVLKQLPVLLDQSGGGEFFKIDSVILQKPDLPVNVKNAIADTESARQQAQTAEQFKQAAASFPGGPVAYQAFLKQQAINKAIETGQVKVIPIPEGSGVIVNGN